MSFWQKPGLDHKWRGKYTTKTKLNETKKIAKLLNFCFWYTEVRTMLTGTLSAFKAWLYFEYQYFANFVVFGSNIPQIDMNFYISDLRNFK